jgi:hypothetical protein
MGKDEKFLDGFFRGGQPVDGIISNDGGERPTYFGMWQGSWTNDSYMWKTGNTVYMSHMIPTKPNGKARFAVLDHLHRLGYEVIIPSPSIFVWPEEPATLGLEPITIKGNLGNIVALRKPAKSKDKFVPEKDWPRKL